jgi:hypothetical protein
MTRTERAPFSERRLATTLPAVPPESSQKTQGTELIWMRTSDDDVVVRERLQLRRTREDGRRGGEEVREERNESEGLHGERERGRR